MDFEEKSNKTVFSSVNTIEKEELIEIIKQINWFDDKDVERILKIYAREKRDKYGTREEMLELLKKHFKVEV